MSRVPLILDTDIGEDIDDLYALYLALYHPGIELLAVTTVHGDVQARARLVKKALRLAGRDDIPVGAGISLSGARQQRGESVEEVSRRTLTHTQYVTEGDPEFGQTFPDAQKIIQAALQAAAAPVTLVGIGAESNLAVAVREGAPYRDRIAQVAVMAGEPQAVMNEYNVVCDPEAADEVMTCGLPVFLGTFVQTKKMALTADEVETHFGKSDHPVHRALTECSRMWLPRGGGKIGPVLYDLGPIFWAADPTCIRTMQNTIRVELTGTYTRGQTVRVGRHGEGPVAESIALDEKALMQKYLEILHNGTGGA